MNLNHWWHLGIHFFYTHPYVAIAILAILVLIAFFRPVQTFKTLLGLVVLLILVYILYELGQALLTGLAGKKQMFHK